MKKLIIAITLLFCVNAPLFADFVFDKPKRDISIPEPDKEGSIIKMDEKYYESICKYYQNEEIHRPDLRIAGREVKTFVHDGGDWYVQDTKGYEYKVWVFDGVELSIDKQNKKLLFQAHPSKKRYYHLGKKLHEFKKIVAEPYVVPSFQISSKYKILMKITIFDADGKQVAQKNDESSLGLFCRIRIQQDKSNKSE